MDSFELERVIHLNLQKQHLTPDTRESDLIQITKDIGGLHATASTTPYLSLFARASQFSKGDLEQELYETKTLSKIRCVRKTIYVHAKEWIPAFWKAIADAVIKASRGYMTFRGVTKADYRRVSEGVLRLLERREMTAAEIRASLKEEVDVSSILYYMCDQGLLIRGRPAKSWRDRNHCYGLFADYFPDLNLEQYSEAEAIIEVVKQYLASFGPVMEEDIVWWTGLTKTKVRAALRALEEKWMEVSIQGLEGKFVILCSDAERLDQIEPLRRPVVSLLPTLDPYLMGYKERSRTIAHANLPFVFDRTGNATSVILIDGKASGIWDIQRGDESCMKIFFFEAVSEDRRDQVRAAASALGRFIADREVRLRKCDAIVPLTERPAGSVLAPLKGC
jgi:hypothetical protein